ncbi:MAG: phage holin family protein [Rubritepida sp.]|nr:phage holin family protein [Rubritepida sp.]
MTFFLRWLVLALALAVAVWLIPGLDYRDNTALALAALLLGLVNAFLKPLLFWLALPLTVLSLGVFLLVLNAAMLGLVGWLVPGFVVDGFWAAFFGAIVVSLVALGLNRVVKAG